MARKPAPSRPSLARACLISLPIALVAAVAAGLVAEAVQGDGDAPELTLGPEEPPTVAEDVTGEPVPRRPFDLLEGGEASLRDYAGRPLVVNFFASWCEPCQEEMPLLQAEAERAGDRVAFVGIALQDDPADAEDLVEATGVRYDIGLDPFGRVFEALGGAGMPTTWFVSSEGVVESFHPGAIDRQRLRAEVRDLQ